jgi:hypothetical protein
LREKWDKYFLIIENWLREKWDKYFVIIENWLREKWICNYELLILFSKHSCINKMALSSFEKGRKRERKEKEERS